MRELLFLVDNWCGWNFMVGVNVFGVCGLVGIDVGIIMDGF